MEYVSMLGYGVGLPWSDVTWIVRVECLVLLFRILRELGFILDRRPRILNANLDVESKGFWWWCITHRISGVSWPRPQSEFVNTKKKKKFRKLEPPLWTSGQSSWLHSGAALCYMWGTNWIYICYVEESRPPLWSSGQSSWLHSGAALCYMWGTNWIYICYVEEGRPTLWSSGQSFWLQIQARVRFPALPDFLGGGGKENE
jgi:hypothetical protein